MTLDVGGLREIYLSYQIPKSFLLYLHRYPHTKVSFQNFLHFFFFQLHSVVKTLNFKIILRLELFFIGIKFGSYVFGQEGGEVAFNIYSGMVFGFIDFVGL